MNRGRYMAIPPGAVIPGALPDFRIYVLTQQGSYRLWALEGKRVTSEQLAKLAEGGYTEVYVDLEEQFKYEQYLESNLGSILENQAASDDQKAEPVQEPSDRPSYGRPPWFLRRRPDLPRKRCHWQGSFHRFRSPLCRVGGLRGSSPYQEDSLQQAWKASPPPASPPRKLGIYARPSRRP